MKGIGIIAVIIGHLSHYGTMFIFSFHMPLFFIIAGFLYKRIPLSVSAKKDFNRLVIPYLITGFSIYFLDLLASIYFKHDPTHWLIGTLWGSGSPNHTSALFAKFPTIGAIWFLLALFMCKQTFLLLESITTNILKLGTLCLVISIIASLIDSLWINLPLAILPGVSAVIFYYAGYAIRRVGMFDNIKWWFAFILIAIWVGATYFPEKHMSIVRCYYPLYPLTILGGIAGTIIIYWIVTVSMKVFNGKMSFIGKSLAWLGEVSLLILCFHLIDLNLPYIRYALDIDTPIGAIIFNLTFCIVGVIILSQFPQTRNIFKIKKVPLKSSRKQP